ncbi:hypothetical protein Hanom_Chr09g00844191 [Helianthus anomalus]
MVVVMTVKLRLTYWIMIFAFVHLLLSHLSSFNSIITSISLAAAVMSIRYLTTLHVYAQMTPV